MRLALFDLDNTLLTGDSDHLWGEFLVARGRVDPTAYKQANDRFYAQYRAGTLDIADYTRFAVGPLVRIGAAELETLREEFVLTCIEPIIAPAAPALLERHRIQGDTLLIITATNSFVTAPIARLLDVDDLLATELEQVDGRYTGRIAGTPCYQAGKCRRLEEWRAQQSDRYTHLTFYSDSHNDIPLLSVVDRPIVVDPDPELRLEAGKRGWPVISLRQAPPSFD